MYTFRSLIGGQVYDLPSGVSVSMGFELSDISGAVIKYPASGINADKVVEDATIIAYNDGVEVKNGRWWLLGSAGEEYTDEAVLKTISGKSMYRIFEKVVVHTAVGADKLSYVTKTPGAILIDLFTAAQARGAMTGVTWNFTATLDSAGVAWANSYNIDYSITDTYSKIVTDMFDANWAEFEWNALQFRAFNDLGAGTNLSTTVELVAGRDYADLPYKTSIEDRAHYALVAGDEGARSGYAAPAATGPYGREEVGTTQGGITATATLDLLAYAVVQDSNKQELELTRSLIITPNTPMPGAAFNVGDQITERIGTKRTVYRVKAMAIGTDENGATTASVVFNDRILPPDVKRKRQFSKVSRGTTYTRGGGGTPIPVIPPDTTTPNPPTTLGGVTDVYLDSFGTIRTFVNLTWIAPTLNTNGSALTDLAGYEVAYRRNVAGALWTTTSTANLTTTFAGLDALTSYEFRVRAYDTAKTRHFSTYATLIMTTSYDSIPPSIPSTPTAIITRGTATIGWNGKNNVGGAMEADFSHVQVHRSTVNAFTPDSTTLLDRLFGAGVIVATDQVYSTPYYYKFVAMDESGNASAASAQTTATTSPLISGDLAVGVAGNRITVASTAPTVPTPVTGDAWIDTTNGLNTIKVYTGSGWVARQDGAITALGLRGNNLVTNGDGILGNTYNFSGFVFHGEDAPTGTSGSFYANSLAQGGWTEDELISFDPSMQYRFEFKARQTVAGFGATARMYGYIQPFDAFGNVIAPQNYMYVTGTTTTLATALNPGDTVINLTSSTNWFGSASKPAGAASYQRNIIFWDYVDPSGKAWATGTYSRNNISTGGAWADGGITGNVITLAVPYAGPAHPAGTSVSNCTTGGNYIYMPTATNVLVPETWTDFGDTFRAGILPIAQHAVATTGAATWGTGVPIATAKVRVGWLFNYPAGGGGRHAVAGVKFSDIAASQDLLDGWTYPGTTTINGGSIQTLSIATAQLAAGCVITDKLAFGAATGDKIAVNAITTDKLAFGAATGEKIAFGVLRKNLIVDSSFEDEYAFTTWAPFGSGQGDVNQWRLNPNGATAGRGPVRSTPGTRARSGRRALELTAGAGETASTLTNTFAVVPGTTYRLTAYLNSVGGTANFNLDIQEATTQGGIAGFSAGTLTGDSSWGAPIAAVAEPVDPQTYQMFTWTYTPTAGMLWAAVRMNNSAPAALSTLLLDDVSMIEVGVGGAAELTAAGLRLFDDEGYEATSLVTNRANYFTVQQQGVTLASVDDTGKGSFTGVTITGTDSDADGIADSGFEIYGTEFLAHLNKLPRGVVARANRDTSSTASSGTEIPILELQYDELINRMYRCDWAMGMVNVAASGRAIVRLRRTIDGTTPSITSSELRGVRIVWGPAGTTMWSFGHKLLGNGTDPVRDARLLLTVQAESGNTNVSASAAAPVEFWVTDLGPLPDDTGIDRTATTPPVTKKTYTTTWTSTSARCYMANGAQDSQQGVSDMKQGYSSYDGDSRSVWIFPSMTSALAGSTISKIRVYLYANHWYYNSGGTARIKVHGYSAYPGSSPSLTTAVDSSGWPKPGGRWVTLPSSLYAGFVAGTYKGIGVGPAGTNSLTYYGRFNRDGAKIEITYTK